MSLGSDLRLSWRLFLSDRRAGELRLLFAALLLAVASMSAVGFFTDRVRQALTLEAHQMLGADLLLIADHPWPAEVAAEAKRCGLRLAETQTFPSMVTFGNAAQLADLKAVSAGYPLRGKLRIAAALNAPDREASEVPAPGTLWLDERLATALAAQPGDQLAVGSAHLKVAAILTQEPDRGVNFFSVAPRLLMHVDDLPASGLLGPGARVTYRLLLASDEEKTLAAFRRWLEPRLSRGERLEDAQNGRPEIRSVLERAERFLGLAALLAVVLAAVAVALAGRRYLQRHLDSCAVLRCLGASQGQLLRLYLGQFLILGLFASLAGVGLGYAAHFVLHLWLASLLATPLPAPSLLPALQGVGIGMVLLLAFIVPPLLQLQRVPTLRVLRRELGAPLPGAAGGALLGFLCLAGLMLWVAGELKVGFYVIGGFVAALALYAALAWAALKLLARLRRRGALNGLGRRSAASVIQVVALALGLTALLLLTVTRGELLDTWQRASPADAPNRFVINIQPEQRAEVASFLAGQGIAAELLPMVRGRLTAISGRPVTPADYAEERAQRLVEREFNLSWAAGLPAGNSLTAGQWFAADAHGQGLASVEQGLAQTLGLKLGDELQFTIAGEDLKLKIGNLRKLDWDSMRVNFFVLTPPAVLDAYPASWITSFYLPPAQADAANQLVRRFPNLTVIDVAAILRQLQGVLEQVARAVQFVFLFTLGAGLLVLYATLAAAHDERRRELAILRALGASRAQLRRALLLEFAGIGALAAGIAVLGSSLLGAVLAKKLFNLDLQLDYGLMLLTIAGAALAVALAGWLAAARLLATPPLQVLQEG